MRTCIYILMLAITADGLRRVPDVIEESNEESTDDTSTDLEQDPSEAGVQKSYAMDTMDTSDDNVVEIKHWYGRLGNNLIQVANAIEIAEATGATVVLPEGNKDKTGGIYEAFDLPDQIQVTKSDKKENCKASHPGSKSYPYWGIKRRHSAYLSANCFTQDERHRVMQMYIRPYLKANSVPDGDDDELVIHIRGGDLLDEESNELPLSGKPLDISKFTQASMPACAAYEKVINYYKFEKIRIVQSDNKNPCADLLKTRFPSKQVTVQSFNVLEDFMNLANARNLFLAFSTFSETAYSFSNTVKNVFSVDKASFIKMKSEKQGTFDKVTGTNLVVLKTKGQREHGGMHSSVKERLDFIKNTPESDVEFDARNPTLVLLK